MIKTTIIITLILLLIVTIYSYYCLSAKMINYERKRLEYILQKEQYITHVENNIKMITNCNEKNEKYQNAIKDIASILKNLSDSNIISISNNYLSDKNISNEHISNEHISNEHISNEHISNETKNLILNDLN